jgi:hypothetical protein
MIIQHYERGDYLLTEKGYKVLKTITDLVMSMGEVDTKEIVPSPAPMKAPEKKKVGPLSPIALRSSVK